jgi:hypothetical protein
LPDTTRRLIARALWQRQDPIVHDRTDLGQDSNRCVPVREVSLRSSPARSQRQESPPARLRRHLRSKMSCRLQAHNRGSKFKAFLFPRRVVRKNSCQPLSRCSPSGHAGEVLSVALGMLIGGMQLPKRGSSGSYRDLSIATMYSNANAIEPSNTSTQTGGQAPIRTAAVMQVIKATTPKVHFALLEGLETKPRGVIVWPHLR